MAQIEMLYHINDFITGNNCVAENNILKRTIETMYFIIINLLLLFITIYYDLHRVKLPSEGR